MLITPCKVDFKKLKINVISIFERESVAKNNSGVEKLHVQVKLAELCPLSSTTPLLLLKTKYVKGLQMLKEDYEVGIISCES
jgi:hypothetical protein